MESTKTKWHKALIAAAMALLISFAALGVATFAWYIYNTSAHTTKVHMSAGSSSALLISEKYDEGYGSSIGLKSLVGEFIPVSTNRILNGFQDVYYFKHGEEGQPSVVAYIFKKAPATDYYKRTMYLKSGDSKKKVYISGIKFEDSSKKNPISSSIRVGLVTYKPGDPNAIDTEYIFEINPDEHIEKPEYNTDKGHAGQVLDSEWTDGRTIDFTPYKPDRYYYAADGSKNPNPLAICECDADHPVRVDVYIWLEGCDTDCAGTLGNLNLAYIQFIGEE